MSVKLPLSEYPRPQMKRKSYLCLNGEWDYAITDSGRPPESYDGRIIVPYSPECGLSGVNIRLEPMQYLWYRRIISIPAGFNRGRVLLHFGAVDQIANVYVNGTKAVRHEGGYTPFHADITDMLTKGENLITVRVKDASDRSSYARGKQKLSRRGMWYTPQSGIWQTVWLESVPEDYVQSLRIIPMFDEDAVKLTVFTTTDGQCEVDVEGRYHTIPTNKPSVIKLNDIHHWSPEEPYLYPMAIKYKDDSVSSYFGLRKFTVGSDENGVPRLMLNNEPYFRSGLLDQGYYGDGIYTPASDEDMIRDIKTAKKLGFNMLRKHAKVEPLRWYYHCDRLGILVWQDMVNGGGQYSFPVTVLPLFTGLNIRDDRYKLFGRADEESRARYIRESDEMIDTLFNCVSVELWTLFNEGWGQFDAEKMAAHVRKRDKTRFIDHASGWHDQGAGDIKSVHVYFRPYRFAPDNKGSRPVALTEFGGYKLRCEGHTFGERSFGYKDCGTQEELNAAVRSLYEKRIIPAKESGLCAAVYTQLSDVEDELNGVMTADRNVLKLDADMMSGINERLINE